MQPGSVRKQRIDKRLAHVNATARGAQHPLDGVAHDRLGEHDRRELATAPSRAEDVSRIVPPHLFDVRIVEKPLQRPISRDAVVEVAGPQLEVAASRGLIGRRHLVEHIEDSGAHGGGIDQRIRAAIANEGTHPVEHLGILEWCRGRREGTRGRWHGRGRRGSGEVGTHEASFVDRGRVDASSGRAVDPRASLPQGSVRHRGR